MKYSITFQSITPESAVTGDFERTGFHIEPTEFKPDELRYIINEAEMLGIDYWNGSWFESIDPEHDFRTGEEIYYNLHFEGVSNPSLNRIEGLLR